MNTTDPQSPPVESACSAELAKKVEELEAEVKRLRGLAKERAPRPGIGGTIQRLRISRGIGPRQLSDRSGVSCSFISMIEKRDHAGIALRNIVKVAAGLGIRPSELIEAYERDNAQNAELSDRP